MNALVADSNQSDVKIYHSPQTLLRRFVAKRTSKSSLLWGLIFGVYMISKATAFIKTYSTPASRQKLAESLGTNVGIEALLGTAHHIETISGYAVWNFLCLIAAGGAIWALIITTRMFRGEEDAGRRELFLAGQTTARGATVNVLIGLGCSLLVLFLFIALGVFDIARLHGANFTTSSSLFFAVSLVAGAAEFVAIAALVSQLMPVRSRAVGVCTMIFGVFYLIRLTADSTNAHWLLAASPLGWIEELQPMTNSQPLWLIPIILLIVVACSLAIYFAGRRDLGSAIFADKDTAKEHKLLLRNPLRIAFRQNRSVILAWIVALVLSSYLYGLLAKSAGQAVSQSSSAQKVLTSLSQGAKAAVVLEFMGIVFFLTMLILMFFAASSIGRIREDEANGYLDNMLVRPVSRFRWIGGRVYIAIAAIVMAAFLSSIGAWAGEASQHGGVGIHTLLLAGLNATAPVILILGIGVFIFGFLPRLTSIVTYGAIAWSFLIVMLSSGLNLNHWLLDSSILHQISFAPAAPANWTTDVIMVAIACTLAALGALWFNSRDLQNE